MPIVPTTYLGKIEFYEAHIPVWTAAPAAIGLVAADCTLLDARIKAAREAYTLQQAALDAAKSATEKMHLAVKAMHALGSADIAKIKAFADATNNPGVYPAANLPAPATPTPVGPPGTPSDFIVTLMQSGAVNLRWKCANPTGGGGTNYKIQRRVGGGGFALMGITGVRTFTDETIPAGASGVVYQITAFRSTTSGMPAQFNVNFGVGGDGTVFATVTEVTTPMKMAA
ncbi:MAG TPA: hypothetical protein PKE29_13860 [Phycisphaerales bacterium]|nr:hypothetical protein [Phycisphaerales bacterium]